MQTLQPLCLDLVRRWERASGLHSETVLPNNPFETASTKFIRVLTLDPGSRCKDPATQVSGTVKVINLMDTREKYATLSYVWGKDSDNPLSEIICNTYPVPVTRNCHSALLHLREILPQGMPIWVDAICINQRPSLSDPERPYDQNVGEEKSRQIQIMGDIYASADNCYIWLGKGNSNTSKAMEYLRRGGLPFSHCGVLVDAPIPTGNMMALRLAIHLSLRVLTFRKRPHPEGLEFLLGNEWIKRVWTIQEALLSKRLAIVCGSDSISWTSMIYALEYMAISRQKRSSLTFPLSFNDWKRIATLRIPRHDRSISVTHEIQPIGEVENNKELSKKIGQHIKHIHRGFTWFYLIISSVAATIAVAPPVIVGCVSGSGFFDEGHIHIFWPVYGLFFICWILFVLGFLFNINGTGTKSFRAIVPDDQDDVLMMEIQARNARKPIDKYWGISGIMDKKRYELSHESTLAIHYHTLTAEFLRRTSSLNILLLVSQTTRHQEPPLKSPEFESISAAPSWTVDWREPNQFWFKALLRRTHIYGRYFHQDIGTKIEKYLGATAGSPAQHFNEGDTDILSPPWSLRVKAICLGKIEYSSDLLEKIEDKNAARVLPRSIVAFYDGIFGTSHRFLSSDIYSISNFAELCTETLEPSLGRTRWVSMMQGSKSEAQIRGKLAGSLAGILQARKFHIWMNNFVASRKAVFVRCSNLGTPSLGVAAGGARKHDMICLVQGVQLPMIIRPNNGRLEVIGPAFVPVFMDGSIWMSHRSKAQTLILG